MFAGRLESEREADSDGWTLVILTVDELAEAVLQENVTAQT